jgi:hypothetical protein
MAKKLTTISGMDASKKTVSLLIASVLFISLNDLPACAAPNGLTQIPIAKVFGDGVTSFSAGRVVQPKANAIQLCLFTRTITYQSLIATQ